MQSGNGFNNASVLLVAKPTNPPHSHRFVLGLHSITSWRSARATGDGAGDNQPESSSQEKSNIAAAPQPPQPQKSQKPQKSQFKKPAGTGFGDSTRTSKKSSKGKSSPAPAKASSSGSSSYTPGVRRRPSPSEPLIKPEVDPVKQRNETIAEVVLLGFLSLIVIEGITLAASGFLPDEWDDFLVKYIFPSFTPTMAVFVASAAGYGLYKFLGAPNKQ